MEKLNGKSKDIVKENIEKLRKNLLNKIINSIKRTICIMCSEFNRISEIALEERIL